MEIGIYKNELDFYTNQAVILMLVQVDLEVVELVYC
jgi:hypothetical protein